MKVEITERVDKAGIEKSTESFERFSRWVARSALEKASERNGLEDVKVYGQVNSEHAANAMQRFHKASFLYATKLAQPKSKLAFTAECIYDFPVQDDERGFDLGAYVLEQLQSIGEGASKYAKTLGKNAEFHLGEVSTLSKDPRSKAGLLVIKIV